MRGLAGSIHRRRTPRSRGGWDAHVASLRKHPHWHPDVTDGNARKQVFKKEYPWW